MARMKGNHVMKDVYGMFGKQIVFKKRLGTQYVAAPPNVDEDRVAHEEEAKNRENFGEAIEFGKWAVKDPEVKATYAALAKGNQTAYNVAVSDARVPPKINSILTKGYNGQLGSCILIQATDNVKVKRVHLAIYDRAETVVEQGEASDNGDNFNWIYSATIPAENTTGYTVEVKAYDIAGNETTMSVLI